MKSYIGTKEVSASIVLFSLAPAFLTLIGTVCTSLANGAILSFIISALICLVFLVFAKLYLKKANTESIITVSRNSLGRIFSSLFSIILSVLIFFTTSIGFSAFCANISNLSSFSLPEENIRFILVASACICALSGIESLTRQSYIVFLSSVVIVSLLVLITIKGINKDNLYPILGTDIKGALTNYKFIGLGVGLAPLLLISDHIKKIKKGKNAIFSAYLWIFFIALTMIVLYLLTVPHPMGSIFNSSLEAVFSSASSGEVLHRFELFLLLLFAFLAIESVALCLYCTSYALSQLTQTNDTKPFILILTPVIFFISKQDFSNSIYITFCTVTTLFCVGFILLILIFGKIKEKI